MTEGSSGGGASASSQAISGSGAVNFGTEINPWLIGGIVAAAVGGLALIVWIVTRK